MKYWLYEDRRLSGPFEAEAVLNMPGVSRATLVCPADRDGRAAADWLPVRCVDELRALKPVAPPWPGFGPRDEESEAELEGIKRSMASLEMRLRALQAEGTREWVLSQSRSLRSSLADLKETIAAQDARSDSIEAALAGARKTVEEMRAHLDAIVERRTRAEKDLSGEFAELRKDLTVFRTSQEDLKGRFEGGLVALQRASDGLDPRIAALEERLTRAESGISARLAALQAAVEGSELEPLREQAVARITEALERLGKTVSLVQSRMVGLEERQDRTDPIPKRIDALRVSLVSLSGQVSEVERAQAELRASAARWGEAHASVEAMRAEVARGLRELSQSPVLQGLERLLNSAAERLAALEAGTSAVSQRLESLDSGQRMTGQHLEAVEKGGRVVAQRLEAFDAAERQREARARELERRRAPVPKAPPAPAPAPPPPPPPSPRWRDAALALGGVSLGLLVDLVVARSRTAPAQPASPPAARSEAPEPAAPKASPPAARAPAEPPLPGVPEPTAPAEPAAPKAPKARPDRASVRPAAGKVVGASLRPDGIEILFEGRIPEPRVDLRISPPRLVVDLFGATTDLPSNSLGAQPPHILDARLGPSPVGPGVRVDLILDKAANYKILLRGRAVRVQLAFEERGSGRGKAAGDGGRAQGPQDPVLPGR